MPVPGRPLTDGPKRNRVAPLHDFTDVVDEPYAGPVPVELPETRSVIIPKLGVCDVALSPLTVQWWATVSSMPHCALWTLADWQFALSTAIVADVLFSEGKVGGELRQRERIMGTTRDARMSQRIRYVSAFPVDALDDTPAATPAAVTNLDDRRRRSVSA